jgi:hypothetical protein
VIYYTRSLNVANSLVKGRRIIMKSYVVVDRIPLLENTTIVVNSSTKPFRQSDFVFDEEGKLHKILSIYDEERKGKSSNSDYHSFIMVKGKFESDYVIV